MKYICLVYLDQDNWNACSDSKCGAFVEELVNSGHLLLGEPLHTVEMATTVRIRNGQLTVTDGPFAETKEMLAGFYLVDAVDLNEAIKIASRIPPAEYGSIEVRPVRHLQLEAE